MAQDEPRYAEEQVSRRHALQRFGQWSLGVAATVAGLTVGSGRASAEIPGDGCCNIYWKRACTGQEWSQGCGRCTSTTDELGRPSGKWWWSCRVSSTTQRFCGECYFLHCHMMFNYSGSPTRCNSN